MKELTVRECEAVSGSGLADLFRPGTGNVSPPVTPEKTGGTLIIGGGNRFRVWNFSVYDRKVHWRNDQNSFLMQDAE
ncbi:hypothetical protein WKC53_14770 [Morganella morganii]|uniref:hypothetical protein n=1 Tax=Morganella morganii TaxID=582 RepID=UPI0030FEF553